MKALRPTDPFSAATLLCALSAISACAPVKPTIRTNADPGVQLSSYHTYAFVAEPGTNRAGYSTPITTYFKDAIRKELDSRGYRYSEPDPDLFVNFNANAREKVDLTTKSVPTFDYGYYGYRSGLYAAEPAYVDTEIETVRYKIGTANVDLVDARKKQVVWEALAEGRLSDAVMKNPQPAISSVIADMFAKFPRRTGGTQ